MPLLYGISRQTRLFFCAVSVLSVSIIFCVAASFTITELSIHYCDEGKAVMELDFYLAYAEHFMF